MLDKNILTFEQVCFSYCRSISSLTLKGLLLKDQVTSRHAIFQNLSLALEKGKRYALVGDNGAGKSSLALMVMKKILPESGCVNLNGKALSLFSDSDDLFQNLDVKGFIKVYLLLIWPTLVPSEVKEYRDEILKSCLLTGVKNNKMSSLSKGMRQKLLLSIYTAKAIDLLIIDESLSGIDSSFFPKFKERLNACLGEFGTLVLVDHNKSVLEDFCDEVLCLKNGSLTYFDIKDLKLHVN